MDFGLRKLFHMQIDIYASLQHYKKKQKETDKEIHSLCYKKNRYTSEAH